MMEVVVDVPERDLAGDKARSSADFDLARWNAEAKPMVELSSVPGRQFPVTLSELATAADPNTRTFRATFTMEKPEGVGVLSGMTAKLVLTGLLTTAPDDFLVPAAAVVADSQDEPFVWLVDEESMSVSKRSVTVGKITGGDRIVVTEGLEGGEAIAMTGVHLLTEGRVVTEMEQSDETRQ
jgi:RND family efflux transporter MFP subunit